MYVLGGGGGEDGGIFYLYLYALDIGVTAHGAWNVALFR